MNKETFLEELRGYLRILEDQEQEDILEEYAQHIDMKLQKGLSEEEAIRDFGPMRQLAAEILEAYHVKPEFDKKSSVRLPEFKGGGMAEGGKLFRKMGAFLKDKSIACMSGISRGLHWCAGKCRALAFWMKKPFSSIRARAEGAEESALYMQEDPAAAREEEAFSLRHADVPQETDKGEGGLKIVKTVNIEQRPKRSLAAAFFQVITKIWDLSAAFCIWWMRLFWNLLWLFMALFFGGMALITLAGLGTVLVLLPQGYPMAGMLLICLGAMLCLGVLAWGSCSLVRRRKKEEREDYGMGMEEYNEKNA